MWTFYQTGMLIGPDGKHYPSTYSGFGEDKDKPEDEAVKDMGPLPCGWYTIGHSYDSPDHGPLVLPLTPDAANEMFGRSGFLIHGDSIPHPGTASKGCIVAPHSTRVIVNASMDKRLWVTPGPPVVAVDPGTEAE